MGIKARKPTTPSQRQAKLEDFKELSPKNKKPEKSLTSPLKKRAGRNAKGRLTMKNRGGGHKRKYRIIDFKRDKENIKAEVVSIEYDPNRSSHIALLKYEDGERRYIIAPAELNIGDKVISGKNVEIKTGNALPVGNISTGIPIHNIELKPGRGAKICRGAGTSAAIMAHEGDFAHVRLPSGEIRLIGKDCKATIGQIGNINHERQSLGKAGRNRWKGRRPRTRAVAKNPVDHPLGGGEGKSSGGRHPCTPSGKPTKGLKTRRKKKYSDKYIIKKRPSKKKRRR
jgi:large subunit ribosomal protein L2